MNITRLTTKLLWMGLALSLSFRLSAHLAWQFGVSHKPGSGVWIVENALKTGLLCLGYVAALLLNLEIAKEHRQTRWLHAAWLALAANAGVSVIRMTVESSLLNLAWPGYTRTPLWGLLQHLAIVPANLFLLLGLLAMWWAYQQVGLGFTVEKRDYAVLTGILAMMMLLIFYREGLSEARSPYAAGRWLQIGGLILLSLCAAASFVLHRQTTQMGGGKLAVALRFLTFYALLRGALVLIQAEYRVGLLDGRAANKLYPILFDLGWQAVPWIAALAAAYRVELTAHAAKELQQYRTARAALA
jgi:hypothetical protein